MSSFVGIVLIEKLFSDVYQGELTSRDAGKLLHALCNVRGLNPAIESPITMLMTTEQGRRRLQEYETFLTQMNWLMAKLSAQIIPIENAIEQFTFYMDDLTEEMLSNEADLHTFYTGIACPMCRKVDESTT